MNGVFFVHIMKTGGTALTEILNRRFGEAIYPSGKEKGGLLMKQQPHHLLEMPEAERSKISAYSVHMPAWVAAAVAPGFHAVTVLREPVARTVSHLRQISRLQWAPDDLEAIWDDESWRSRLANYQTRYFSAQRPTSAPSFGDVESGTAEHDELLTSMRRALRLFYATGVASADPLEDRDLTVAQRRLRSFDLVGVTEDLAPVAAHLSRMIGADRSDLDRVNVTDDSRPVPLSLVRRLEADLRLDLELYETGRTLTKGR